METATPTRIAGEELREELQQVLGDHFGNKCRILSLRRRRSKYSSSFTIENLKVEVAGGKGLKLVFKDLSPSSMLVDARRVRPHFLYAPLREIETYRSILQPEEFGTATFYGAVEQHAHERYWLFLERVEGPLLWQVGRFEQWESAARWLARFHSRFTVQSRSDLGSLSSILLRYDAAHCWRWLQRAERFLSNRPKGAGNDLHRQFRRLAAKYDRVVERLLSMPATLIHAEFYPSNILMRTQPGGKKVCPIDWEVTAIGPGLIDLAALASGTWSQQQKEQLLGAYRDTLEKTGSWPPELNELVRLVDYCQIHLAVQWLGWAPDWAPPKDHEQNWLAEAVRLAQNLQLI